MASNYFKKLYFIIMTLSFFSFGNANNNPLVDKKWVIIEYNSPFDGIFTSLINDTTKKVDCSNNYIVEFHKKGKIVVNMNNKITSKGKYLINGKEISIDPRIDLNYYDTDKKCTLTTEKRIILTELLSNVKSFEIADNKLILHFKHAKNKTEGKIILIRQSKL